MVHKNEENPSPETLPGLWTLGDMGQAMSLEDEVDAAARETAARLDIIAARLDWDFLGSRQWHRTARAKTIHRTYDRFESPEHVVAIIEGRRAL